MKITIHFSYTEVIVPKRCRNARPVQFDDGTMVVDVPEVTSQDAPIAIRSSGKAFASQDPTIHTVDFRWWKGSLWTSCHVCDGVPRGRTVGESNWDWPALPAVMDLRGPYRNGSVEFGYFESSNGLTRAEVEANLVGYVASHLIIDGVLHRFASEPRFVVMTFGMGHNHGGTSLSIDTYYNSNIGHGRYFSLLDRQKAIDLATEIATARGDTKSVPIKPRGPQWEIILPEAIQVKPAEQHGDGNEFLNTLEAMTVATLGAPVAGVAVALATAAHQ